MEPSPFQARYPSFDNFVSEAFSKLVEGTRIANKFPSEDEYKYHATNREFSKRMKDYGSRLLGLIQRFLDREGQSAVKLTDVADVDEADEKFSAVVDVVDNLIERVVRTLLLSRIGSSNMLVMYFSTIFDFAVFRSPRSLSLDGHPDP
jgi:hypothetical protein